MRSWALLHLARGGIHAKVRRDGHRKPAVELDARWDRAWLAVVAGNTRARRFYERSGWRDVGAFDNTAWTAEGTTIPVPAGRYEKYLAPSEAG